jgi:DNA polymerase-3 subunit alpha
LKGFSKPAQLAQKCADNSYRACGIADYKSLSGAVTFYQSCMQRDIKPIIGCSFDGFSLFAKNKNGWLDLIQIVSSIDTNDQVNNALVLNIASKGNLISIAQQESDSPINGQDFYQKSESFMDIYYTNREDAPLHRILLCSSMKTTLSKVNKRITIGEEVDNHIFFESNDFFLKNRTEISAVIVTDPKINQFDEIYDKCEVYDILNKPMLPKFSTPEGVSENEHLTELCRDGWRDKLQPSGKIDDPEEKNKYAARIKQELDVIFKANLSGYFLIVQDIVDYVNRMGWLSGPGRGSAAGCLISYLIGVTKIDPIEFDLLFERFYNSGRNTENYISLPDIDMDVPGNKRDNIIHYLKETYGHDNVSQMLTFGRLRGRSALKEVLRVNNACGFSEMNEITKAIPNEADISDQLQEMDEEDRSIIRWALLNNPEELRDYCFINDRGQLDGDYADFFDQAIKIEGTFKTQGKHAAGVVISIEELNKVCPMVNQKSGGEKIAGLEMADLEALGHVKFDVLGISLLDKIMKIKEII